MLSALLLAAYAGVLAGPGASLLRRARWPERAPRPAIAAWLALAASVVGSVAGAAVTAGVSATHTVAAPRRCHAPARWACDPFAPGHVLPVAGAIVAIAVAARVVWCAVVAARATGRTRRAQLDALALVGRTDPDLGATVIDHPAPGAYCVPGHGGRVVVTAGAVAVLDGARLAAVLAHERAHLRQRHHLALAAGRVLSRAFPFVPAFGAARDEITRLVELAADDAAARYAGRLTVAAALLGLAEGIPGPPPAVPALAAGGTASGARARRLIAEPRPLGPVRIAVGLAVSALVLAAPLAATASVLAMSPGHCCGTSSAVPAGHRPPPGDPCAPSCPAGT